MRIFGLIGFPLGHSFSRDYFKRKFKEEGIEDVEYRNFPIEDVSEFEALIHQYPDLHGVNVTIPYKESILKYLDVQSADVREIGAVNTICLCRKKEGKLARVGHNTDVVGFRRSLEEHIQSIPQKAIVLGTGGSSRAVCYVLKEMGVDIIKVSRYEKKDAIGYEDIDRRLIESATLIVNTTPLGMYPKVNASPAIPYEYLGSDHLLFDLVYNPEETLFMKKGKEMGAHAVNGYDMLVYQAEGAWEIWNR